MRYPHAPIFTNSHANYASFVAFARLGRVDANNALQLFLWWFLRPVTVEPVLLKQATTGGGWGTQVQCCPHALAHILADARKIFCSATTGGLHGFASRAVKRIFNARGGYCRQVKHPPFVAAVILQNMPHQIIFVPAGLNNDYRRAGRQAGLRNRFPPGDHLVAFDA